MISDRSPLLIEGVGGAISILPHFGFPTSTLLLWVMVSAKWPSPTRRYKYSHNQSSASAFLPPSEDTSSQISSQTHTQQAQSRLIYQINLPINHQKQTCGLSSTSSLSSSNCSSSPSSRSSSSIPRCTGRLSRRTRSQHARRQKELGERALGG